MDPFTESALERFPRIDPKVLESCIDRAADWAKKQGYGMVVVQSIGDTELYVYGGHLRQSSDTSRVIVVVEPSGLVRYAPQGGAH